MDIDIWEEWFGIANGLNSFINNRVIALDWYKNVFFFLNILRTNGWILINFCICIDIYKIHVVIFGQFLRVMAFACCQNFVYAQYLGFWSNFVYALILTRCRFRWLNNIFRSFSTALWPLIYVKISFMLNSLWTNWWILIKFCKCIDTDKMYIRKDNTKLFFNWVMALDWCQNFVSV